MAPHIERLIDLNELDVRLFVEPFAGGASAALHMLHTERAQAIGLMDKDPLVASFWKVVFFDTDWLVDRVLEATVTLEKWESLKSAKHKSDRDRAFACMFLNRTSFSGILNERSGPLGGKQQKSIYKIDCRFPQERIAAQIRWLGDSFREQVLFVWNWSWKRGLAELRRRLRSPLETSRVLLYVDPPFFNKADRLYNCYFRNGEHAVLRNYLKETQFPWFLSYDDCAETRALYHAMSGVSVNSLYCASRSDSSAKRHSSSELVVTNLETNYSEIRFPRKQVRGTKVSALKGGEDVRSLAS